MSERDVLKKMLKERIDLSGVVVDVLDEILEPALEKVVADTSNPFDDMIMATVYPVLSEKIKELAKEKLDDLFD